MKNQGEIRVRIIDNLSDHEGYEEGTILKIKEINEDEYMISEEGYTLSAGEVEFINQEGENQYYNTIKKQEEILYARKCDITGEGMNEGWCWGDGLFYSKYEADTIIELRKDLLNSSIINEDGKLKAESWTDDAILKMGYDADVLYWTEWEEEDLQYKEVNGELIELED